MKDTHFNFSSGWDFFQKSVGGSGAFAGNSYVTKVEDSINKLQKDVLEMSEAHRNMGVGQLKGFMAEIWHTDTFNIDAAVKGSSHNAEILKSTEFASVDIKAAGNDYSLKYYKTGKDSAFEQAKTYWQRYNEDMANRRRAGGDEISFFDYLKERNINESDINKYDSIYNGQFRLIPKEQMDAAIEALKRKIEKESMTRPELVAGYQETLDRLQDRIKASDGTESIPLSRADSERIAQLAKEEKFDPKDFGISTDILIGFEEVMQQAVQAGLTAAVISCILKVAPEIYKAIDMLIKDGEVSKEQFEKIGFAALSGGAQGFVRGSISAALTISCKSGLLGASLKSVDPTIIGTLTVVVMNTISNSYKLASKKISKAEFAHNVAKDIFVSTCSVALGGAMQGLVPELPVLGYLLGSFIGSLGGSFLYDTGYSAFMSLCCDTGFTCFGLVDQDYKIPKEILERAGFKTFDFSKYEPKRFEQKSFEVSKFNVSRLDYQTIKFDFLKREVIGIGKIGYKQGA